MSGSSGKRSGVGLRVILFAVLMGVVWAGAIYGAFRLGVSAIYSTLAGQESPYFHENFSLPSCGTFLLILLALPFGFWISRWAAYRSFGLAKQ